MFEHEGSNGTQEYISKRPYAKFCGCTELEQTLFEDGLLSLEPNFMEVISRDPMALIPHRDDDVFVVPDIEKETANDKRPTLKFISGAKATLEFIDELDQKAMAIENKIQSNKIPSTETPLASILGPPPESLEHAHFRNLIANGYFESIAARDDVERDEIKLFANLLVRGFWDRSVINEIFPWIDLSDFEILKRKICLHVRMTLPERAKRFEKFWSDLTTNQREAVWLYYMKNPHSRSKEFIAEKIGISVDSLKDRLAGAVRKLKAAFPELSEENKGSRNEYVVSSVSKSQKKSAGPARRFTKNQITVLRQNELSSPTVHRLLLSSTCKSWDEYKAFLRRVSYQPETNGTW